MNTLQHRAKVGLSLALSVLGAEGCAGHENRVQGALDALDRNAPAQAIRGLNEELGVRRDSDVPSLRKDNALLLLDRGTVLLSMDRHRDSARDMGLADHGLDVLDLSRTQKDELARHVLTDDAGPYRAPAHEKLLLNTLNMVNYLAMHDLSGARVEARRLAVMQKFLEHQKDQTTLLGIGSYLAGFTFEQSGRHEEALLFYEEALRFAPYASLREPLRSLKKSQDMLVDENDASGASPDANTGEIIVVLGYGRVARKIPMRIPVGQALQLVGTMMNPADRAQAEAYAVRGLVTWVNYPALGTRRMDYQPCMFAVDGQLQRLDETLDVDAELRRQWREREPSIVLSALTRLVARTGAGYGVQEATAAAARAGSSSQGHSDSSRSNGGNALGMLLGLATTATMSAADTPDTRSWSTLPARITVGRVRVPAGEHSVTLSARGVRRSFKISVDAGGWAVVPMFVLR